MTDTARSEAARLLGAASASKAGKASAKAATPEQRVARATKGGKAAQAKLTPEERGRRAKLRWQRRRKWEQREAQLAMLEAENETLRERVRELESHHAAQLQGGKAGT